MAELKLSISTAQAETASRDFQRILNDIKNAARELDNMSLNTLGGTIARLTSEAEKFRQAMSGVSGSLSAGLNVNTSSLNNVPAQLNAITTAAQSTASAVKTVAEAFQQGLTLTPGQMSREFERQRSEVAAIEESFRQKELQANAQFRASEVAAEQAQSQQLIQARQGLVNVLENIQQRSAQALLGVFQNIRQQAAEVQQPALQGLANVLSQRIEQLQNAQTAYQAFATQITQPQQPIQIAQFAEQSAPMQSAQRANQTFDSLTPSMYAFNGANDAARQSLQALTQQFFAFNGIGDTARLELMSLGNAFTTLLGIAAGVGNNAVLNGQQFLALASSVKIAQDSLRSTSDSFASIAAPNRVLLPQFTQTGLDAQRQAADTQQAYESTVAFRMQQRDAQARQDDYMAQVRAQAAARPAAAQTFLPPGTLYGQPQLPASPGFADPTSQGVSGIAISNNKVYETLAGSANQAQQALVPLGRAFTQTKVEKDALDKNLDTMSSGSGSLWRTSFSLRILAGAVGFVSFRALERDARALAETLVDTGQKIERATALFGLMGDSGKSTSQEIELATKTAQDFGLAILPSIEGLGKMQAAAYGTAVSGDVVNRTFQALLTALATLGADAQTVTRTTNAFADSIGREEFSGRTIRQLSRELPGFKERIAEAFGAKDVQEFIVRLDKGNLTMTQFLLAAEKAFGGGSFLQLGRENVNRLTGAVSGLENAWIALQKAVLDAGIRQDIIAGYKDLTAVLTSPTVMDAAKQFGQIFGVIIKAALEIFAYFIDLAAHHVVIFSALVGGLVTSGVVLGLAASIGLLSLAFTGLTVSMGTALLGLGGFAVVGAVAAAIIAYATGTDTAQKTTDALAKSTQDLKTAFDTVPKATPTEHMLNYQEGQKRTREEGVRLAEQTVTNRVELDLLFAGVEKSSAAFTGLATAYKFAASEAAKYNVLTADQIKALADSATAAANYAAEVNKIGQNRDQIRSLQDEKAITGKLTGLASQGANESVLAIERQFQDQFQKMKEHFDDLIYNEQDLGIRNRLVETFKNQANALRDASIQAQLYANRLKAIQDLNQGAVDLQLERDITSILSSPLRPGGTEAITPSTPSTIESFRPATINPASEAINAFQFQLDRANIGAQNQVLNGPVQMSINGPVAIREMTIPPSQMGAAPGSQGGGATIYDTQIQAMANKYNVDFAMVKAVIRTESGFNPHPPTGLSGEEGLGQQIPETARRLRIDPTDPNQSIEGTAKYLRALLDYFQNDVQKAIAAYRAGEGNIERRGIATDKDRWYVDTVEKYMKEYTGNLSSSAEQSENQPPQEVLQAGIGLNGTVMKTIWSWVHENIITAAQGFEMKKFLMGSDAPAAPTLQQLPQAPPKPPLELTVDIEKSSTGNFTGESIYDQRKRMQEEQRQREITRLGVEQQGLRPTALGGAQFDTGEVSVAQRPRTLLEMERDIAGRRAVGQYNQTVQLTQDDVTQNSAAYQRVQQQRAQAEFQGRAVVDQKTIQDQERYNISLISQNNTLKETAAHLKDDAKYRDIDTQAANMLREATEKSVSPEILAHTQGLIKEWQALSRAAIDANGPLQQYKDSLLGFGDINKGLQDVAVGALKDLGDNYLNVATVRDRLTQEGQKRTQSAQEQAVRDEDNRYAQALQRFNRGQQQPTNADQTAVYGAQLQKLRAEHDQLSIVAKDTQDSFSAFDQIGFLFRSFADSIIDSLQKMIVQMLIIKPLAAELQGALSGQPVSGGFAQTFGAIFGSGSASSASEAAGAIQGFQDAGFTAGIAGATGGYVTLQGVQHFERGGRVRYGTDSVPAMLTPGEMILNKAQQQSVSAGLQSGGNTYVFAPTIHAQDGPSVRKTLPQIQGEFYRTTERLAKRNNLGA